jgi:hypothetical protein
MAGSIVDEALWDEFHRVVNMTSRELRDWLSVQGAGEETEEVPDRAGSPRATGCSRYWANGAPMSPPTTWT